MKTLFALLGLFALAGCEDTPATGGYTASRASYPTDQPIYTGPQDPALADMFYIKCGVLQGQPFPEPVEIRGTTTNRADLEEADVVITNIHQLQGAGNRWLEDLPNDFFDLILFDEGHHNVREHTNL